MTKEQIDKVAEIDRNAEESHKESIDYISKGRIQDIRNPHF